MKAIFTGGHLAPALAVLDNLPKSVQVVFIGRKHTFEGDTNVSFEYKTFTEKGVRFRPITTGRLQRKFTRYTIPSLFKLPIGLVQSFSILLKEKPDLIVSFGGYISFPVVVAGAFLGIPVIVHEQTLSAGLANKVASVFARKILVGWEEAAKDFPKEKVVITGNPMREFKAPNIEFQIPKDKEPLIYITGGSAGSHTVNKIVEGCLEQLLSKFRIIHQTGDSRDYNDFEKLHNIAESLPEELKNRYALTKFVPQENVGVVMNNAMLVISRAGINTITELISFNKPCILIPLNDEQMRNALFVRKLGLAEIADQDKTSGEALLHTIQLMIGRISSYGVKGADGLAVGGTLLKKDAAATIAGIIITELENKTREKSSKRAI